MKRLLVALGVLSMLAAAGCSGGGGSGAKASPSSTDVAAARAALASTGELRLGFPAAPPFLGQQDPVSSQWKGLAISLGTTLASSLGVKLVPVEYPDPGQAYRALVAGRVDVVFAQLQIKPDAAAGTEAVVSMQHSFLVEPGSKLTTVSGVDSPGMKVGSLDGDGHTPFLAAHLQHAQLVKFTTNEAGIAALKGGLIDAYAGVRFALAKMIAQAPGSRILDGSFFTPGLGFATLSSDPKGAAFLNSFVASEKSNGDIQRSIDAMGLPGVLPGPAA